MFMNQEKIESNRVFKKKISNILKDPSTKHFLKELSFLILLCPNTMVPFWVHIFKNTNIVIKKRVNAKK